MADRSMRRLGMLAAGILLGGIGLLGPESRAFGQDSKNWPDRYLDAAGVRPGMIIGEIGAGSGALTFPLAVRVGEAGRIYANDIDALELKRITAKSLEKNIRTIEIVIGGLTDPRFPVAGLDMIIMKNVLHDVELPLSLLENAAKYLKPGAPLVLIDGDQRDEKSSRSYQKLHPHFYSKDELIQVVEQSCFKLEKSEPVNESAWAIQYVHVFRADPAKEESVWTAWLGDFRAAMAAEEEREGRSSPSPAAKLLAWEKILFRFRDDNPQTRADDEWRDLIKGRIRALKDSLRIPAESASTRPPFPLRSEPLRIDDDAARTALTRLGFQWQGDPITGGDFSNRFEAETIRGAAVVRDRQTGLEWHPGSDEAMDYFAARQWTLDLNARGYAGGADWRLPTLEEAASLLSGRKSASGLQLDSFFSSGPAWIWTDDEYDMARMWYVAFEGGSVYNASKIRRCHVMPVRSLKPAERVVR
jgi:ubiquinone/menaquinone biosynthesis C-methylase UbiE